VGAFVLLGLLGLVLILVVLRKILLRRREQRFVQQVIEQDEAYRKTLGDKEKAGSKEMQDRWKEAVTALRKSHLKKYGNPLYVLPWYMVVREKLRQFKAPGYLHLSSKSDERPVFPEHEIVTGGSSSRPFSLTPPAGMPFLLTRVATRTNGKSF
jgi:hypothetical protein